MVAGSCVHRIEALVRKTRAQSLALAFALTVLGTACPRRGVPAAVSPAIQTQTIAPATAQPAPTGTDSMTQTVDVEDSRSEDDGATITNRPKATTPAGAKSAKTPKKNVKKN